MIVGVPRESYPGERRVGLVPMVVTALAKAGVEVVVETGAGVEAGYRDRQYIEKGAKILPDRAAVFGAAILLSRFFVTALTTPPARPTFRSCVGTRFWLDFCVRWDHWK